MKTKAQILRDIQNFQPDNGNGRELKDLLSLLWAIGADLFAVSSLLAVFDWFPDEDGAGVFWSIVHIVEALVFCCGQRLPWNWQDGASLRVILLFLSEPGALVQHGC